MPENNQSTDTAESQRPEGEATSDVYDEVLRLLEPEPKGRLLDAPAGKGILSRAMADQGFEVVAADIDTSKLLYPEITSQEIDLNGRLPWEDGELDCVVCVEGVEHLESPYVPCREFFRVLKEGGILIITTPNVASLWSRIKFLLTGTLFYFDPNTFESAGHLNPIPWFEFEHIVRKCGFEVEAVSTGRICWVWRAAAGLLRVAGFLLSLVWDVTRKGNTSVVVGGIALIIKARKPKQG